MAMSILAAAPKKPSFLWGRVRAVTTGVLFFFPGFLLSLFVTVPWAKHYWAGEAQAVLGAFWPSVIIGLFAAIICSVWLLKRVKTEEEALNNGDRTSNS